MAQFRLHDRFRWTRDAAGQEVLSNGWSVTRLNP
jgi:pyridoxine/pyridoxamine 5'-phosphate oxidase